jgi:hypothetical protein
MIRYFYTNNELDFGVAAEATDLILIYDGKFTSYDYYVPTHETHPHLDPHFLKLVVTTMLKNEEAITKKINEILSKGYKFIIVSDDAVASFEIPK